MPRRQTSGLLKGEVLWKEPTESIIIEILRNPAYAGAFVYGRRLTDPMLRKPGQRGTGFVRKPIEDWMTRKQGAYPAYITWEQYLQNQARLAENTQAVQAWQGSQQEKRGAPREGEALLQGLMCCSICGYRMRVAYKSAIRYYCDGLKRHRAGPACMSVDGCSLEKVVIQAFFDALQPAKLDALEAVLAQRHQEEERLEQYFRDQVKRATYEAHLARRRYEAVDPENRLVAASLERQWEEKLVLQRQAEEDAERFHQRHQLPTLTAEMRYQLAHIGQVLPDLWKSGKISNEYKKRLLRSLITRVIATRLAPDQIEVKIVWISGHFSVAQVTPSIHRQADVSNYEEIRARIDELFHNGSTDAQIATQLTQEGYHTARQGVVSVATVRKLRLQKGWLRPLYQHRHMPMVNGYWTIAGLTQELGVGRRWLSQRIRQGKLEDADIQRMPGSSTYLIRNDAALLERLRREAAASRKYDTSHS